MSIYAKVEGNQFERSFESFSDAVNYYGSSEGIYVILTLSHWMAMPYEFKLIDGEKKFIVQVTKDEGVVNRPCKILGREVSKR